ncbi:MAG: NAD-dependent epimerase/dehydratase family protein [Armatimonadota bacterium]|nr:NAD-dependent epimerase/dehydratase family protein [bacterium]
MNGNNNSHKPPGGVKRRTQGKVVPVVGVVEWFRPGEHDRVERVLADLKALRVEHLRTGISWADWHTPEGPEWYRWLFKKLAESITILPCFLYTPTSLGISPKMSSPPRDPRAYADFLDVMITEFGEHFEWVELWNEPNNVREWDYTLDQDWMVFCRMVGGAAYWAKQRGKKTALGGMSPVDPSWLEMIFSRGVGRYIDAFGIHGFPDTFDYPWFGWDDQVEKVRGVLEKHSSKAETWITEAGFSTWRHDEHRQLCEFLDVVHAPVDRVYWYAASDLRPELPTVDGFHLDEREYHFGLKRVDDSPKLLYRIWGNGGIKDMKRIAELGRTATRVKDPKPTVLITGGAGFIGTNLARRMLDSSKRVVLLDNLSRPGVERNVRWLCDNYPGNVDVRVADVRDLHALKNAVAGVESVFHFAAQVAVTTSLVSPIDDFEVNAHGTLNLLEAIRTLENPPPVIFTSTNKVYGALEQFPLVRRGDRYEPHDSQTLMNGIGEQCPVEFHSPYGCSKGSADQYVLDYSRTFGLKTAVFRMSCIYGPHQLGTEDQGWVAHFLISAIEDKPITLYGDGMQVRDILFVDDLVNAFLLARENIDSLSGNAFNIGGGPGSTISLLELVEMINDFYNRRLHIQFEDWRLADQRYYVSDTRKFNQATGWTPLVGVYDGVARLGDWLLESRGMTPRAKYSTDRSGECKTQVPQTT